MLPYVNGDRNRFAQQLFTPLPQRYDRLAEVLSMGQNGRWRRAMVDRIVPRSPATVLDVATGTAGVALQLAERTSADVVGVDLTMKMLDRGQHNIVEAGQTDHVQLVAGRGRAIAFSRSHVRRADLHLPASLRRGSSRDAPRARSGRETRGCGRKPRVLRAAERHVARHVVALHPIGSASCWFPHRWTRMVPRRPIPGSQYLESLSKVSIVVDGGGVASGRFRSGRRAGHEPRRWSGDVGNSPRWLTKRAPTPAAEGPEVPHPSTSPPRHGVEKRPAFYAARPGGWRDWWTLLHPPYTAWHLSYVVIGACLAAHVSVSRLLGTLLAFLCAVGFAADALDELHGRPLGTRIPTPVLITVTVVGLAGAVALGIVGVSRAGWVLIPFLVLGPLLVLAYNLELFGGFVHTDIGFALAWGSFPLLVAYVAQTGRAGRRPPGRRSGSMRLVSGTTPAEYTRSVAPSPRHLRRWSCDPP